MIIISLNLWFNSFLRFERSNLFIKYINIIKPDIILLQECTKETLAYIYHQLTLEYPYIHTNIYDNNYGLAILSKKEIKNRNYYKFKNSKMNRGLLFCEIDDIIIATTHLESQFVKNNTVKINQFNNMIKLLSKYDKVIIGGDTNLTKKDDKLINHLDFKDIYYDFQNKDNNYTYDGITNPLINNNIRSRIDRFLVKGNIKITNFLLNKEFIMSDHYSILCTF